MSKTLIVNLYGGPGSGKSTTAAAIFAELKWLGINCEKTTEYAKDIVWEESFSKLKNQIYVFAKQHNKQFILEGKVDVIINDSPFALACLYDNTNCPFLKNLAISEHFKRNNLNIFLKRDEHHFVQEGRMQDLAGSIELDNRIKEFLKENNIKYLELSRGKEAVASVVDLVIATFPTTLINN